jgi:hypothetical protein
MALHVRRVHVDHRCPSGMGRAGPSLCPFSGGLAGLMAAAFCLLTGWGFVLVSRLVELMKFSLVQCRPPPSLLAPSGAQRSSASNHH